MKETSPTIPVAPLKRAFDILASSTIIVLLSPVILFFFVLFEIESLFVPSSRGSFFYRETRISQGKPFLLTKIRTFKRAAIEYAKSNGKGIIHTKDLERDKSNLTFTGKILHQIYMDEAPQLFSVLTGDMTLVGPRPTNPENYEKDIANGLQAKRVLCAGLTGWFQTHKHIKYNLSQEEVDMDYARFCQTANGPQLVLYDLFIIVETAITVLRAEGL